jgi:hypothetical protein
MRRSCFHLRHPVCGLLALALLFSTHAEFVVLPLGTSTQIFFVYVPAISFRAARAEALLVCLAWRSTASYIFPFIDHFAFMKPDLVYCDQVAGRWNQI